MKLNPFFFHQMILKTPIGLMAFQMIETWITSHDFITTQQKLSNVKTTHTFLKSKFFCGLHFFIDPSTLFTIPFCAIGANKEYNLSYYVKMVL